jgi:CRP/FNR family transcriptional regulator, cyclic AMP receptor protein
MKSRFEGPAGRRLLIEALRAQRVVVGSDDIASRVADVIELRELATDDVLVTQNHADNDLYLIIAGTLNIDVNGRRVGTRSAGTHVGEMALIDPAARRSATVTAAGPSLVGKVTEPHFTEIADTYPRMWRALAVETAERLRQRGRFLRLPNGKPIVFIGSSREALPIAIPIRDGLLCPELEVRLWTDGVFGPSRFPMEDLERQLEQADFAVLVAAPDDHVSSRGKDSDAPRDNVVFELGLFMGALARLRTFVVVPRGVDLKIPTDILGLTPVLYDIASAGPSVTSACAELKACILKIGVR